MSRFGPSLAALMAAIVLPGVAVAADWGLGSEPDFLRGTFYSNDPKDWTELGDGTDTLGFEFGVRYWYSWGAQNFNVDTSSYNTRDNAHLGELHLRIDDQATRTYVKGLAGYSAAIDGSFDSAGLTGAINDGHIGYIGADIGWNALGDANIGLAGLLGYLYWNDSPRTSRESFTVAATSDDIPYDPITGQTFVPMDSLDNDFNIHALRLGLSGRVELGDMFDFTAELAAVPYANVSGTLGAHGVGTFVCPPLGNICSVAASETAVSGWGYGGMGEAFIGITPIDNLTFRLGARAWYLQGTTDATYQQAAIGDPSDSDIESPPNYDTPPAFAQQGIISTANPFSLFRYGLLAELTYSF